MKKLLALIFCLFAFQAEAAFQQVPPLSVQENITSLTQSPMQMKNHKGRILAHSIVLDQFNKIWFPGGTTAHNFAAGAGALSNINTGGQFVGATDDISIGWHSGWKTHGITNNGEAFANVYIGTQAGEQNTTGHANVGIGFEALQNVTTGIDNVAINYQSLNSLTSGQFNVAMGIYAGTKLTTNGSDTLIGTMAGRYMDAQNNTFIGYQAGCGDGASCPTTSGSNMTGTDNVGVGLQAGANLTSGSQNVFVGTGTGEGYTSTSGITLLGFHTGVACTNAGGQVALIGWAIEANNTECEDDTAIGYFALGGATSGHDNTAIGNFAGAAITNGTGNVLIGDGVAGTGLTTGSNNIMIGNWSPAGNVSNTIGIGMVAPGSIDITGSGTLATEVLTLHGLVNAPNLAATSAAQTGTVCWLTGSGATAGRETVDTTLACLSSLEELKDIQDGGIPNALDEVMKLKPFWYTWKKGSDKFKADPSTSAGLGAHATEAVDKRLVGYGPDGKLRGVKYLQMAPVLAAAIQQQQLEIKALTPMAFPFHKCFFNLLVCPNSESK